MYRANRFNRNHDEAIGDDISLHSSFAANYTSALSSLENVVGVNWARELSRLRLSRCAGTCRGVHFTCNILVQASLTFAVLLRGRFQEASRLCSVTT